MDKYSCLKVIHKIHTGDFSCACLLPHGYKYAASILVYNPPATSEYRIALDQRLFCFEFHLEQIRSNALSNQRDIFVLGVFNLPTAFDKISNYEHSVFTFFEQNDLAQMVEFGTHKSGNTLELIFTNSTSFNTYPPSSLCSDHYAVFGGFASFNDSQNDSHYSRPFSCSSLNKELCNALLELLHKRMYCNQQPSFLNHFTSHNLFSLPICKIQTEHVALFLGEA